MNTTTLEGHGNDIGGKVKEGVGSATGDQSLKNEGLANQITGNVQKSVGAAKDAVGPLTDKAKGFAKQRPWAAAALAGVVGLAVLNTLRGK